MPPQRGLPTKRSDGSSVLTWEVPEETDWAIGAAPPPPGLSGAGADGGFPEAPRGSDPELKAPGPLQCFPLMAISIHTEGALGTHDSSSFSPPPAPHTHAGILL